MSRTTAGVRNLVLVLGDQLDAESSALDGFDRALDCVWMAEVAEESNHVWSHKARIALFLSAMRHYRDALQRRGYVVTYRQLDDPGNRGTLAGELGGAVASLKPKRLIMSQPGDHRVLASLKREALKLGVPLEVRADRHFLCSPERFRAHVEGRKQLRLEYFYREMREATGCLLRDGKPEGGKWNLDTENRVSFGRGGPKDVAETRVFEQDATTKEVLRLVDRVFASHPGSLEQFNWPVTSEHAKEALGDFVARRLVGFGKYQDAMWTGEPFLSHSLLSSSMNLKLIDPRLAIQKAEEAYRAGEAPLNSVEGFIRQILGWREYVRGVYWHHMPDYLERNALNARLALPEFYWTGETRMNCLGRVIEQTLRHGYAHHIQRLMVTGLFALLLGCDPKAVHEWYLAVYVDAVEWVELPNTLGMSQYADGGVMASKPYAATGKYIQRMSNYCEGCPFNPAEATGPEACPFTVLYWDFLNRHRLTLSKNQRMVLQIKNLERKTRAELKEISRQAEGIRERCP